MKNDGTPTSEPSPWREVNVSEMNTTRGVRTTPAGVKSVHREFRPAEGAVSDHLIRGFALQGRARVLAAETTGVVEALREIHEPSRTVTAAMGRVATGALLMAAGLEKATAREPMVTIEVSGDGPAGKIMATASPTGWVRSFVANPAADAERITAGKLNVAGVVGTSGFLVVTRDTGASDPYRGVVPLFSGEIAEDLAVYLNESEQTPSAVLLGVLVGPG
jgi:molecular chaperone Hsp33